ncbi:MAG: MopE-related protein, partial [Candidatus Omnitrophica bacterium]|nr:MopE-related protein [Candidatus Omnitrophota bacterium]
MKFIFILAPITAAMAIALSYCATDDKTSADDYNPGVTVPDMNDDDDNNDNANQPSNCTSDIDCDEGMACDVKYCRKICGAESPCEDGYGCFDGFCYAKCENDLGCFEGESCEEGHCRYNGVIGDDDASDDDSGTGDDADDDSGDGGGGSDAGECLCDIPGADYFCDEGECIFQKCKEHYYNLNSTFNDGCEYYCEGAVGNEEVCDGVDNDCNGNSDDMTDFLTNPEHCGDCNTKCEELPNADISCVGGKCRYACKTGFYDIDGSADNGCESEKCEKTNNGVEICDGRDNDCNGETDETFDKTLDASCGPGCIDCTAIAPHYVYNCENEGCVFKGCEEGWYDLDGNVENGCEKKCTIDSPPTEVCDGRDNDCNAKTPDGNSDPDLGKACTTGLQGACSTGRFECSIELG